MSELRTTQVGVLVESVEDSALLATQAGVLVESSQDSLNITQAGVLVESSQDSLNITQMGVLLELEGISQPYMATYFKKRGLGEIPLVKLPESVTGYQLDTGNSFWSVVLPEESENLIVNPSFERNMFNVFTSSVIGEDGSGYASYGISHEKASRGYGSFKGVLDGSVNDPFVAQSFSHQGDGWYTFSFDLWSRAGREYRVAIQKPGYSFLDFYSTALAILNIKQDTTGWVRYSLTFPVRDSDSFTYCYAFLFAAQNNFIPDAYFHTDGWMVEKKHYATTYFDGDMIDDSWNSDPTAYMWSGLPHGSTSLRSGTVWDGGKIVSLQEADFKTTAIVGLGYTSPEPQTQVLTTGEEVTTNSLNKPRDFSVVGRLINCSAKELQRKRQVLIDLLDPNKRNSGKMILRYQPIDRFGHQYGKALSIPCTFVGGLEGNITDLFSDSIELKFHTNDGRIYEEFNEVVELDSATTSLPNTVIYRDPLTKELTHLDATVIGGVVKCVNVLINGDLIVGGSFTSIGGVSAKRIARYKFSTQEWVQVGQGIGNGSVLTIAVCDTVVLFGGDFTQDGSGNTINRIAYTIATIATTTTIQQAMNGLNDTVRVIEYHPMNYFYIGGDFTATVDSPVVSISKLTRCLSTLGAFEILYQSHYALAFNSGSSVYAILPLNSPSIVISGNFTSETSSMLTLNGVAKYDPENKILYAMGEGIERVADFNLEEPNILRMDKFGTIYLAGLIFEHEDEETFYPGVLRWTGSEWVNVFDTTYNFASGIRGLEFDFNNNMLFQASNVNFSADSWAVHEWDGVSFIAPHIQGDIAEYTLTSANKIFVGKPNGKMVFINPATSSYRISALNEVQVLGTATTSPVLVAVQEGSYSIRVDYIRRITNHTTNCDVAYAIDLDELNGAILYEYMFNRVQPIIRVNGLLDITNQFADSQSPKMILAPGLNRLQIAVAHYVYDGISIEVPINKYYMYYRPAHWSIDAGVI